MHAAGQEVAISILAARYMRVMIPGLAFAAVNESLKRYLMAQNVVIPETIAVLISTALSPFYNQILVIWAGEAVQSRKLMESSSPACASSGSVSAVTPILPHAYHTCLSAGSAAASMLSKRSIQHWHTCKIGSLGVLSAGFGLDGAAWAVNLVQVTSTIGIGGYIIWRERQLRGTEMQTWHGW